MVKNFNLERLMRGTPMKAGLAFAALLLALLGHFVFPTLVWILDGLALLLIGLAAWRRKPNPQEDEGSSQVAHEPLPRPASWSRDVLRQMDWKRYEEVCSVYYEEAGIPCKAVNLGRVGGIDVRLYQNGLEHPSGIVRCKASSVHRLDGQLVVDLAGAMARQKIPKGFYMTREGFHEDAVDVALRHDITLVDSHILLSLIQHLSEEAQHHLLHFATAGDWSTPTCPACGIKMAKRLKKGMEYWRCPNAVRCGKRLKISRE